MKAAFVRVSLLSRVLFPYLGPRLLVKLGYTKIKIFFLGALQVWVAQPCKG